jgi:hypothetical protein
VPYVTGAFCKRPMAQAAGKGDRRLSSNSATVQILLAECRG